MRYRIMGLGGALAVVFLALSAAGLGQTLKQFYSGVASANSADTMSFVVQDGGVSGFRFVNRCPGNRGGTPVPGVMRIVHSRFSYNKFGETVTGRLLANGTATGTERDVTGDCDSGLLTWQAHVTGHTIAPTPAERGGILRAFGDPPAAAPCLNVLIAASNHDYGTLLFRSRHGCLRWAFNGVAVFHRVRGSSWRVVYAASTYRCPVASLPRSVQRDLGVCP